MFRETDVISPRLHCPYKAKAGECYSEPIAKFHRGHNPHPDLPYLAVGLCFTSPDREHVTNSVERPW